MPLDFEAVPGVVGRALRLARRSHDVYATGPSVALATMIPAFGAQMQADGSATLLLRQIQWLLLVMIKPGDDVPPGVLVFETMIHVNRLGAAFEHLVTGQLDVSPCSPSVARARVKKLAMQLMLGSPQPFTAVRADLYETLADQLVGSTQPDEARVARLGTFVSPDGTYHRLADAELVFEPRIDDADRGAGGGFDFFFTCARATVFKDIDVALLAAFPPGERARQIIDFSASRAPEDMLASYHDSAPARMAYARSILGSVVLDASNVTGALEHLSVFALLIPTDVLGPQALRLAGQLVRTVLGIADVTPGTLTSANAQLAYLRDRAAELRGQPVEDRVGVIAALLVADRRSSRGGGSSAHQAVPGGPADAEGDSAALPRASTSTGYPAIWDDELRAKINSASFRETHAALVRQWDLGGPSAHPFSMIAAVLATNEIIYYHALFGYKEVVTGVRLVGIIATNLRQHGAAFLGDLCIRTMLPPMPLNTPRPIPPRLDDEWKALGRGSVDFDLETLKNRVTAFVLAPERGTYQTIAPSERFKSETRLVTVEKIAVPFYAELGYPSPPGGAGTPAMIFGLATTYYAESHSLRPEVVSDVVHTSLGEVMREAGDALRAALVSNNPSRSVAGKLVVMGDKCGLCPECVWFMPVCIRCILHAF
jgi:hypothetical protein